MTEVLLFVKIIFLVLRWYFFNEDFLFAVLLIVLYEFTLLFFSSSVKVRVEQYSQRLLVLLCILFLAF